MNHRILLLLGLSLTVFFSACKKDGEEVDYDTVENYYRTVSAINVEVAYEPNAIPYTQTNSGDNLWLFTQNNIEALFDGRALDVAVTVPPNLAAMTQIPAQNRDNFSAQDVLNLANRYREGRSTATLGSIWVVFLDGYFKDDDSLRTNVLGVNLIGTPIVAIFKPVIENASALQTQKNFLEQTTLVHELGHALGLVNSGVPLTSNHHDSDNGAHCSNQNCVMYWQNQGLGLLNMIGGGMGLSTIVFGSECLQDTRSFVP